MTGRIVLASQAKRITKAAWQGLFKLNDTNTVLVESASELKKHIKVLFPHLVLMEHCFDGVATDGLIASLTKRYRKINIAVWNMGPCTDMAAARLVMAGAASFINLRDPDDGATDTAVKTILAGKSSYPAAIEEIIDQYEIPDFGVSFTRREREIINLTAKGKSNKEIAVALGIGLATVKYHKYNVYRKMGIKGDGQICLFGIGQGFIDPVGENLELGGMETE
jgi:DNA-binding NarL/FixJ family response regulator